MGVENALLILAIACGVVSLGKLRRMSFSKKETLALRGLLALIVVIGHCDLMSPGNCLMGFLHMATPAVSVFFFLSGYGLMASYQKLGGKYVSGLIPRSIPKLFVPYLVAVMLWMIYQMVAGSGLCAREMLSDFARGHELPPHSWYVFVLFLFYVVFSICFKRFKPFVACWMISVFTVIIYAIFKWGVKWPFWWWCSLPAFSIGLWWRYYEVEISEFLHSRMKLSYLSASISGLALWVVFTKGVGLPSACLLYLLGPLVALVLYAAPAGILRLAGLTSLGCISYEIYLFHCIPEHWLVSYISASLLYCLGVITMVLVLSVLYNRCVSFVRRGDG